MSHEDQAQVKAHKPRHTFEEIKQVAAQILAQAKVDKKNITRTTSWTDPVKAWARKIANGENTPIDISADLLSKICKANSMGDIHGLLYAVHITQQAWADTYNHDELEPALANAAGTHDIDAYIYLRVGLHCLPLSWNNIRSLISAAREHILVPDKLCEHTTTLKAIRALVRLSTKIGADKYLVTNDKAEYGEDTLLLSRWFREAASVLPELISGVPNIADFLTPERDIPSDAKPYDLPKLSVQTNKLSHLLGTQAVSPAEPVKSRARIPWRLTHTGAWEIEWLQMRAIVQSIITRLNKSRNLLLNKLSKFKFDKNRVRRLTVALNKKQTTLTELVHTTCGGHLDQIKFLLATPQAKLILPMEGIPVMALSQPWWLAYKLSGCNFAQVKKDEYVGAWCNLGNWHSRIFHPTWQHVRELYTILDTPPSSRGAWSKDKTCRDLVDRLDKEINFPSLSPMLQAYLSSEGMQSPVAEQCIPVTVGKTLMRRIMQFHTGSTFENVQRELTGWLQKEGPGISNPVYVYGNTCLDDTSASYKTDIRVNYNQVDYASINPVFITVSETGTGRPPDPPDGTPLSREAVELHPPVSVETRASTAASVADTSSGMPSVAHSATLGADSLMVDVDTGVEPEDLPSPRGTERTPAAKKSRKPRAEEKDTSREKGAETVKKGEDLTRTLRTSEKAIASPPTSPDIRGAPGRRGRDVGGNGVETLAFIGESMTILAEQLPSEQAMRAVLFVDACADQLFGLLEKIKTLQTKEDVMYQMASVVIEAGYEGFQNDVLASARAAVRESLLHVGARGRHAPPREVGTATKSSVVPPVVSHTPAVSSLTPTTTTTTAVEKVKTATAAPPLSDKTEETPKKSRFAGIAVLPPKADTQEKKDSSSETASSDSEEESTADSSSASEAVPEQSRSKSRSSLKSRKAASGKGASRAPSEKSSSEDDKYAGPETRSRKAKGKQGRSKKSELPDNDASGKEDNYNSDSRVKGGSKKRTSPKDSNPEKKSRVDKEPLKKPTPLERAMQVPGIFETPLRLSRGRIAYNTLTKILELNVTRFDVLKAEMFKERDPARKEDLTVACIERGIENTILLRGLCIEASRCFPPNIEEAKQKWCESWMLEFTKLKKPMMSKLRKTGLHELVRSPFMRFTHNDMRDIWLTAHNTIRQVQLGKNPPSNPLPRMKDILGSLMPEQPQVLKIETIESVRAQQQQAWARPPVVGSQAPRPPQQPAQRPAPAVKQEVQDPIYGRYGAYSYMPQQPQQLQQLQQTQQPQQQRWTGYYGGGGSYPEPPHQGPYSIQEDAPYAQNAPYPQSPPRQYPTAPPRSAAPAPQKPLSLSSETPAELTLREQALRAAAQRDKPQGPRRLETVADLDRYMQFKKDTMTHSELVTLKGTYETSHLLEQISQQWADINHKARKLTAQTATSQQRSRLRKYVEQIHTVGRWAVDKKWRLEETIEELKKADYVPGSPAEEAKRDWLRLVPRMNAWLDNVIHACDWGQTREEARHLLSIGVSTTNVGVDTGESTRIPPPRLSKGEKLLQAAHSRSSSESPSVRNPVAVTWIGGEDGVEEECIIDSGCTIGMASAEFHEYVLYQLRKQNIIMRPTYSSSIRVQCVGAEHIVNSGYTYDIAWKDINGNFVKRKYFMYALPRLGRKLALIGYDAMNTLGIELSSTSHGMWVRTEYEQQIKAAWELSCIEDIKSGKQCTPIPNTGTYVPLKKEGSIELRTAIAAVRPQVITKHASVNNNINECKEKIEPLDAFLARSEQKRARKAESDVRTSEKLSPIERNIPGNPEVTVCLRAPKEFFIRPGDAIVVKCPITIPADAPRNTQGNTCVYIYGDVPVESGIIGTGRGIQTLSNNHASVLLRNLGQ